MSKLSRYPWLIGVAAGSLLGVGFIIPVLWFLSLAGIVVLFWLVAQPYTYKRILIAVWLAWFIKYVCALSWYSSLYPLTWVEIESPVIQVMSIFFYWMTCALWLSVGSVLWVMVMRSMRNVGYVWQLPVAAIGWLSAEIAAAVAFSIATYGLGGSITAAFSFGMVGYLFGTTTVGVYVAALGGVYGLSFIVVYSTGLGYLVWRNSLWKHPKTAMLVAAPYCLCIVWFIHSASAVPFTPLAQTVLAIDTRFTAAMHKTEEGTAYKQNALLEAVSAAQKIPAYAILLPEDSRYFLASGNQTSYEFGINRYRFSSGSSSSLILDTGRTATDFGAVLRAYEYNPMNNQVAVADKQYLVPQGEFMPWFYAVVYTVLGYGDLVRELHNDGYRTSRTAYTIIPIMFCFESVDPKAALRLASPEVSFIAHPLSHGWFNTPKKLWQQLDVMLQLQARSAGISIISAANMAEGKLYMPNGDIAYGEIVAAGDGWEVKRYRPTGH